MPTPVKTNSAAGARAGIRAEAYSSFWLLYFIWSIAFIGLFTAYLVCTPIYLLSFLFPPLTRIADRILCKSIALLMRVQPWFNGDVEIEIPEGKPSENKGILLVSNHRSHLDAFLLLSRVPGIRILAKKSLFYIPFLNFIMLLTRQIPVARGDMKAFLETMDRVRFRLRIGEVVHIFPEMTRCPAGHQGTLNFSSAPFSAALNEKVRVVPVVFKGTDEAWPKGVFGLKFKSPIVVRTLEPLDTARFESADQLRNEVRRRIDEALK